MKILNWTFSLALLFSQIALIEFSSRWWIVNYSDPLQRARKILALDSQLGWIARPHLNVLFENKHLFTDDQGLRIPSDSFQNFNQRQILVLGPSSAFGWGVEYEEAWPALIAGNTTLNASQVGYSIAQGQKLYSRLRAHGLPGIKTVIIAYGVNDIDRFRFFDQENISDVEYLNQLRENKLVGFAYSSAIFSLLARGYQEAGIYLNCGHPRPPLQRVGVDAFAAHLKDLILELRKSKIKVLLVNSANAIQVEPSNSKAEESDRLYQESAAAAAKKQCTLSRSLFFEAKQYESWRVMRDIDRINIAIKNAGEELDVPVADIAGGLEGIDKKTLFVDPIHFSIKGHQLVADIIRNGLRELN